ncbi:MAG: Hsp20/alpha crystallin family protein [Leptolyngbyaceae bacterium]|nr:Hsp20/alpha crystallin family protein [Leptolyngbyaceae bacterium]
MALVRWNPTREIDTLQREMNRLFDDVFTDLPRRNGMTNFIPSAELEEKDDSYHLKLELPGLNKDDLDIQVTAEAVSISGERKSETKSEENGVTHSEFRYGSFKRVIPLPGRIDNRNVAADYKDGILSLNLPKAEEERNKVVKVNLG